VFHQTPVPLAANRAPPILRTLDIAGYFYEVDRDNASLALPRRVQAAPRSPRHIELLPMWVTRLGRSSREVVAAGIPGRIEHQSAAAS
jgi:hypothetical protein